MRETKEPTITSCDEKKGYTKITYTPDFKYFNMKGYTDSIISLLKRYVVETAMITEIPTTFNREEIPVKTLSDYAQLYSDEKDHTQEFLHIKGRDYEVVIIPSHAYAVISFVNGIKTPNGGTHVNAWAEAIFRPIINKLNKPKKPHIKISDVKKYFKLFIKVSVKNPEFDGQSKLKLEAPVVKAKMKKNTHFSDT